MAEIIVQYISIWAPALTAVLGIVITMLTSISKTKAAIQEFKHDDYVKELTEKVEEVSAQNEDLIHCNKLLLEQLTKIKGYADKEG